MHVFRNWIVKLLAGPVVAVFLLNILVGSRVSVAMPGTQPSAQTLVSVNKDHYRLTAPGVVFGDSLQVLLPGRTALLSHLDIEVAGVGFNPAIERVYNGQRFSAGLFGKGWFLAGFESLSLTDAGTILVSGAYSAVEYTPGESGVYSAAGEGTIESLEDRSFVRRSPAGEVAHFSADGRLLYRADRHGNRIEYNYRDGLLTGIVNNSSSRALQLTYTQEGFLKEVRDETGRGIRYTYDADGRLIRANWYGIEQLDYEYDDQSRLTGIVERDGRHTRIKYADGEAPTVARVTDDGERWVSFDAGPGNARVDLRDHLGNSFFYEYTAFNDRVELRIDDDAGWSTSFEFSTNGSLLAYTSPGGYRLTVDYDGLGRIVETADTTGVRIRYIYEGDNLRPSEIIDRNGPRVAFKYDGRNNLIESRHTGRDPFIYAWHPNGILKEARQGNTILVSREIDEQGNVVQYRSGTDTPDRFVYDEVGRVVRRDTSSGTTFEYTYDGFDRITKIYRNGDQAMTFRYDAGGGLIGATDASGRKIAYSLDGAGRAAAVTLPDGTVYNVDRQEHKRGVLEAFVFPNGANKTVRLDNVNRLVEIEDAFNGVTAFDWTPDGLLKKKTYADGGHVEFFYDGAGRLIEKRHSDGTRILLRYRSGRLASIEAPDFRQNYDYDTDTRVVSTITDSQLGVDVNYTFNGHGKIESLEIEGVGRLTYEYDDNNRLVRLTDPDSNVTSYAYDRAGRLVEIAYPNGITQSLAYGQKTDSVEATEVSTRDEVLFSETYRYTDDGFLNEAREDVESVEQRFEYNDIESITTFERTGGGSEGRYVAYEYDENQNLAAERRDDREITYEYEGIGRLAARSGDRFEFDKRGNLVSASVEGEPLRYEYDLENRLRTVHLPDGTRKVMRYSPRGKMVYVKHGAYERHILWFGNHRLLELDGNKEPVKLYLYGERFDQLIGVREPDGVRYLHQDPVGSVRLVTNEFAQPVARYNYLPFGEPLPGDGSPEDYRHYAGHPYDPDLGMYYMRARHYSPVLKRFVTRDPVGGHIGVPHTMNPYLYALNNPSNVVDPEGEIVMALLGVAAVTVATVVVVAATAASQLQGPPKVTAYSPGLEDSPDPGRELREMPARMQGLGNAVKELSKITGEGAKGGSMVINAGNIVDLTDPDDQKAEAARIKAITETIRPDKVVSSIAQTIINEKAKEVVGSGAIRDKIVGEATKKVVESTIVSKVPKNPPPVNGGGATGSGGAAPPTGGSSVGGGTAGTTAPANGGTPGGDSGTGGGNGSGTSGNSGTGGGNVAGSGGGNSGGSTDNDAGGGATTGTGSSGGGTNNAGTGGADSEDRDGGSDRQSTSNSGYGGSDGCDPTDPNDGCYNPLADPNTVAGTGTQGRAGNGQGGADPGTIPGLDDPSVPGSGGTQNAPTQGQPIDPGYTDDPVQNARDTQDIIDAENEAFPPLAPEQPGSGIAGDFGTPPAISDIPDRDSGSTTGGTGNTGRTGNTGNGGTGTTGGGTGNTGTGNTGSGNTGSGGSGSGNTGSGGGGSNDSSNNGPVAQQASCNDTNEAGSNQPERYTIDVGGDQGEITFSWTMFTIKDQMSVSGAGVSFSTGCVSGSKSVTLNKTGAGSRITVDIGPNCDPSQKGRNTQWNFSVSCPGN